ELFPGPYIHVGGDECRKDSWKQCPSCRKRIEDEGLSGEEALQGYFMRRVEGIVRSLGKRMIGWDEIVQGGLSSTSALSCRFGPASVKKVLAHGNRVILCPASHCYFDYYQDPDFKKEPRAHGAPRVTRVEEAYALDPLSEYTPEELSLVLGVECNMWTEYVPDFKHLQYMLLPRLDAFSEAAWSAGRKDWTSFRRRLDAQARRYDEAGYNYAKHVFNR
ncbi:MAG: family 20 glycosylhydrolase, partial [Bacteroidales bacterium]|nr:family 20 glycosylhydrolase [Bacteroidales bacterium]